MNELKDFDVVAWREVGRRAIEAKKQQLAAALEELEPIKLRVTIAQEQLKAAKAEMEESKKAMEATKMELTELESGMFGTVRGPGKPRPKLRSHILANTAQPIPMTELTERVLALDTLATPENVRQAVLRAEKDGLVAFDRDADMVYQQAS